LWSRKSENSFGSDFQVGCKFVRLLRKTFSLRRVRLKSWIGPFSASTCHVALKSTNICLNDKLLEYIGKKSSRLERATHVVWGLTEKLQEYVNQEMY
jgi:hypothetical protein